MKNTKMLIVFSIAGLLLLGLSWWKLKPAGILATDHQSHKAPTKTEDHAGHSHDEAGERGKREEKPAGEHSDENLVRLKEEEMKQFGIVLAVAGPGKLGTRLSLPGEVVLNADYVAHIVPRLPGVVREVRKNIGDTVKKGELMAVIDSRELADAKAEYLAAVEKATLAQAKFSREESLWQKKISAEQEYLDSKQALAETHIVLRSSEQKLHALGFSDQYLRELSVHHDESYTRYEIQAPLSGTVIEKHISLGEAIKEDADVFLIADLSTVWVNLSVYQKDLLLVKKGQKVVISAGHGIPDADGVISYVAPIVKEETRTAIARIVLPNPKGEWRPGMFVTAKVAVDEITIPVLLPRTALQTMDGKTVVFARTEEGFVPKQVTIGRANEKDVEITSGLTPGERYVASGTFTLKAQISKGAFGNGHAH